MLHKYAGAGMCSLVPTNTVQNNTARQVVCLALKDNIFYYIITFSYIYCTLLYLKIIKPTRNTCTQQPLSRLF